MITFIRVPAVIFLLTAGFSASAQTGQLTVEDCVRLAEENHPSLAAAQAAIAAAESTIEESKSTWWPQVDLSAGYHRWQRRIFLPNGIAPAGSMLPEIVGPLNDLNAGVFARATIYDFGEREATVESAEAQRDAASADAGATRADVWLMAKQTFFGLAAAKELRTVAQKNLERTEANLRLAQVRHAAGAVTQTDVLRTQAEVAAAKLDIITADSRIRIAAGRLNAAIGRPADEAIEIITTPGGEKDDIATAYATEHALEYRPEVEAARQRLEAAEARIRATRSTKAPRILADGSYGKRDTNFFPDVDEWQAGVSVNVPLFDGGTRRSREARAEAEKARLESILETLKLRVREEVWTSAAELERAQAALAANVVLVQDREEAVRVVRARYEAGGVLLTDLLETQTALASAEATLAQSRWEYRAAKAALVRAAAFDVAD